MKIFVCVLLAAMALSAAETNVTGKWSGTAAMNGPGGETKDSSALMVLKQEGTQITGTVGPNEEEQYTIGKGSIAGDKITLEVQTNGPLIKFDLVASADGLKGEGKASHDGQAMSMKLDLKRAK